MVVGAHFILVDALWDCQRPNASLPDGDRNGVARQPRQDLQWNRIAGRSVGRYLEIDLEEPGEARDEAGE